MMRLSDRLERMLLPALVVIGCIAAGAATAQETAPPGSPAATRTIDGLQIPAPDEPFGGKIERNAFQSTPFWPARIVPPEGAPNILLIITDDVGFAAPSTFGGVIPTPTLDRIAAEGLRYTNMHSTSLCSPTRAALITGRNHHSVGFGVISEQATGFPGYNSIISKDKATVGRILSDNGYQTSWFGKNHNTPAFMVSQNGPFDQWPTGMGFNYFYGFMGGDTNQWEPGPLMRNTTPIYPYIGNPDYNLTTAMADEAIAYMRRVQTLQPDQPFLVYYAPGGTHAPHHPTEEWVDKIEAMHLFDGGWNALRDTIFAKQKRLGVIPQDAKLTDWPSDLLKTWDQLTAEEKKLYIRQAEVYAAYLAYTDHEIGRVVQAVEDMGELDNTLIIYISGDNGSSAEGTLNGTPNEVAMFNGVEIPVAEQMKFFDVWGTRETYNHMAVPWSWAFDTPFKWTKQISSHLGGVRQGMAISWPRVIKEKGAIRNQFHHVIDVVPTILEATGIGAPSVVDGIAQSPIEGVSMAYTFGEVGADDPSHHRTQYFEMFGNYAIYHEGWMASAKVTRPSWVTFGPANPDPATAEWELYDLTRDWTQSTDLAADNPAKLQQMQDLFWREAERYQVLPLDASVAARLITPRPSLTAGRTAFQWQGPFIGTPNGDAPNILNASFTYTADIEVPDGGGEGVIVTHGGRFGGYSLYLKAGKPEFVWNLVDLERVRWQAPEALTPGKHTIVFDFRYEGLGIGTLAFNSLSGLGQPATGTLSIDGEVVVTQTMKQTLPLILQWDENFDVGADTGSPIDDADYQVPFDFNGTIHALSLTIDRPKLTPEDEAKLKDAMAKKD